LPSALIADADLPSTIARDTEVTAAIATHEAAVDPHPVYTTAAELISAGITAHEALADPHPVYLTQTEGDARYLELTDSANPSASVALSAVNGSATTYMRSDGAPALSQSITPTWTAAHIFSRDGASTMRVGAAAAISNLATFSTATLSAIWAQVASAAQEPLDLHNSATSGDNRFAFFYTEASPTTRGGIDYNRAGNATRYNTTSDRRLKTNIQDADGASLIDRIKVRQFDWKEPGHDHVSHGFIAQELIEVVPSAVSEGEIWQVDNSKLVPLLVLEIQALRRRITELE
jgi:hypothetical protein